MVKAEIKGANLVVTCNTDKKQSNSGKTILVACSHGAVPTEAKVDGQTVYVSLNAYIYPKK